MIKFTNNFITMSSYLVFRHRNFFTFRLLDVNPSYRDKFPISRLYSSSPGTLFPYGGPFIQPDDNTIWSRVLKPKFHVKIATACSCRFIYKFNCFIAEFGALLICGFRLRNGVWVCVKTISLVDGEMLVNCFYWSGYS